MNYLFYFCFFLIMILKTNDITASDRIQSSSDCKNCTADKCKINQKFAKLCLSSCEKSPLFEMIKKKCILKTQEHRLSNVQIQEAKELDKNGGLTESNKLTSKGVFMLLKKLNLIEGGDPDKTDEALTITRGNAGLFSNAIYIIKVKKPYQKNSEAMFIIKGLISAENFLEKEKKAHKNISRAKMMSPETEMQGLAKVENFIIPQFEGKNIAISTTKGAFWYYPQTMAYSGMEADLQKNYVVVLSIAPGKELKSLGSESPQNWEEIMGNVGKAMGQFHWTLAAPDTKTNLSKGTGNFKTVKTVIHGDCHAGNIFYDAKTKKVTLIDTASMAETLDDQNKKSPKRDLSDICSTTKQFNGKNPQAVNKFVEAYVNEFPEKSRAILKNDITQLFGKCPPM